MNRRHAPWVFLALAACGSPPPTASYPEAQSIVQQVAIENPDVVRLTIHAIATGTSRSRVIASTAAQRLGTWSDPEDLDVMKTGTPVMLEEGGNLDYTAPVTGAGGRTIATVGVTVAGAAGATEDARLARAKAVAAEVSAAVVGARKPLW
jgi:iron complex outermembrane receptor protein